MAVYWATILLSVLFSVASNVANQGRLEGARSKKSCTRTGSSRSFITISCLTLILVTGLRYGVGQDFFYTYEPYYQFVSSTGEQGRMEIGFYLLNWVCSLITTKSWFMFLICSTIFFGFLYAAIYRFSPYPTLSIFLIVGTSYFFIFMNGMRQMIAAAILLYTLRFVLERKFLLFALMMLLACSFHSTAIIFLVAYIIPRINLSYRKMCILAIVLVICSTFLVNLVRYLVSFNTYYAKYFDSVYDNNKEAGYVQIAMNIVVCAFGYVVIRKENQPSVLFKMLFALQLIALVFVCLAGKLVLAQRVAWYFGLSSVIFLPMCLYRIADKRVRLLVGITMVALYVVYIQITIGMENANNVLPYVSVLG